MKFKKVKTNLKTDKQNYINVKNKQTIFFYYILHFLSFVNKVDKSSKHYQIIILCNDYKSILSSYLTEVCLRWKERDYNDLI